MSKKEEEYVKIYESERKLLYSLLKTVDKSEKYIIDLPTKDVIDKLSQPAPTRYLKIDSATDAMDDSRVTGFVKIRDLGEAQQVWVGTKHFAKIAKLVADLRAFDFPAIYITVQKDHPLIIGGKQFGFAIAPRVEEDETEDC